MAIAAKRTIKRAEDAGDNIVENLSAQIASLREEIESISDSVSKYGNTHFRDAQHNAVAVVDQVRHQGAIAARQINRQAHVAGRAVQENPIPVIVALGTIALISALIFTATER
jgi:phage host-nuclease inhibitor protein Gam